MDFSSFVLAASTADLADEPAARPYGDCLEFRMDLAEAPLAALETYDGSLPLLVTNRPTWEGGVAPDEGRLETLETALGHEAVEAVDIELATLEAGDDGSVLDRADAEAVDVVVSAHDFESTPTRDAIRQTLEDAANYGDVAKLAVTAESRADTLVLLQATHACTQTGLCVATMAMGAVGQHTRAVAPCYGSRIGYAPVDPTDATAPGQYALETLARLVDDLGDERGKQES